MCTSNRRIAGAGPFPAAWSAVIPAMRPAVGFPTIAALFLAILFTSTPGFASDDAVRFRIEAGGGVYLPFGERTRDAFGSGGAVDLGLAARLNDKGTWFVLGAGLIRSNGRDFPDDNTFTTPESRFTAIPISFGVRHLTAASGSSPVRFTIGAGALTVLSRYAPPLGASSSSATLGVQVDFGPEIVVSSALNLYVREKLMLALDVGHDNAFRDLNYSGATLSVGLSWNLK